MIATANSPRATSKSACIPRINMSGGSRLMKEPLPKVTSTTATTTRVAVGQISARLPGTRERSQRYATTAQVARKILTTQYVVTQGLALPVANGGVPSPEPKSPREATPFEHEKVDPY